MLLSCSHYKEKGERHGRCEPMCEKTTRAARCAHDARAFARFAEARRAYGAHGPQARRARTLGPRWIRWQSACNPRWKQGHATWKTRWNRVGFAPDPRGIPARPTPTKRKMASLQWKSGPAQTKQRTGGAFGEDRHARNLHLLRHQNHNQLREERSAPQGALHASYGGFEAVYSTEGELLAGKLPPRQTKLVIAWAALHKPELDDNWYLASSNGTCFRIDPLI